MSHALCVLLSLFCMFQWVSAGHCAFSDELLLLQEHTHALPKQQKWPDISKIVDEVKEAAHAASDTAKNINDTVHDKLDQAATAGATAIQTVVDTVRDGLQKFLRQADFQQRTLQRVIDEFVNKVQTHPQLHTFESLANDTLIAFGRSLSVIAAGLNASMGTVRDVLSASGFHDVSEDVDEALTKAMGAIKEANSTQKRLKEQLGELDEKINKSAGNLSSEIDKDLDYINKQLHDLVDEVNTTFVAKTVEAYDLLVDRLHEKVEGILPEKQLNQVVDALDTIAPVVENITDHVANPIQSMATAFQDTIAEIREHVPSNARRATGLSLVALAVIVCTTLTKL